MPIEEKTTPVFDPDKVKQTKTYSISVGDVTRVKDMGEFLGMSDAAVLSKAIRLMYFQTFSNEPVKNG